MEKQGPTHPLRHSRCNFRSCRPCGLVHEGMGPGRSLSYPHSTTVDPAPWWMQSWPLISVGLCWWPGENSIWETWGPCAGVPMVKVGPGAVLTRVTWEVAQGMKCETQNTPRGEHPQRSNTQWLLSQCVCSNPTCLHHRSETQWRNRSGGSIPPTREQTPPLTGQWQPESNGKLPSISRAGSGQNNSNHTPYQG